MPVLHSRDKSSPRERKDKRHLVRRGATIFKKETSFRVAYWRCLKTPSSVQSALLPWTGQRLRRRAGEFRGVYSPCFATFGVARTLADRLSRLVDLMQHMSSRRNSAAVLATLL